MRDMPRWRFTLSEFSGALADLGVLLPLTLALVSMNGIHLTSALVVIGLAYGLNAFAYHLPVPVQPLKSLAATALALQLSAGVITAGAWWMAVICLGLAVTGVARRLAVLFPPAIVRGIQLGLAALLLQSAWGLIQPGEPGLVLGSLVVLGLCLWLRPDWAALALLIFGLGWVGLRGGWPAVTLKPAWPALVFPAVADFGPAFWLLAVPQVPLSLANSIYSTAEAARQYYREQAAPVTPKRLLTTMGLANVAAALWGGVPICHGSGGLTAHYRLGARTGGALLMLAGIFLAAGLFGGAGLLPLVRLIPFPVLGVLLVVVALQHGRLALDLRGSAEWLPALAVAVTAWLTRNLVIGYAAGLLVHLALPMLGHLRRIRWASQSL